MRKLIVILVLAAASSAQAQRVFLMSAPQDTLTRTFYEAKVCQGLTGVPLGWSAAFDYALTVAGNDSGGRFEVLLLDKRTSVTRHVFLGSNYRKGTEKACEIVKGHRQAAWVTQ